MAGRGSMSPQDARQMMERINAKKEANRIASAAADERRRTDPLERAKSFLRRRGWHCFNENVLPGKHRSKLVVVGRTPRAPEEVIAMANRLQTA